jgi:transcriptional regulator with XRE-family HTH domain
MMDAVQFGQTIRDVRKTVGLSQAELAEKLGVTSAAVSQWESGRTKPDVERTQAIERALRMGPGVLLSLRGPAVEGPSLDYWVGRWEQQTMHFRRLLSDQEELLAHMREKAGFTQPLGVPAPASMPAVAPNWVTPAELAEDDRTIDELEDAAIAARASAKRRRGTG